MLNSRFLINHEKVRSTIHRSGNTLKPSASRSRSTILSFHLQALSHRGDEPPSDTGGVGQEQRRVESTDPPLQEGRVTSHDVVLSCLCAGVHLYSVPQDAVSSFQHPWGDSAFLRPHSGGLMQDRGYGLPRISLLGGCVNKPPADVPEPSGWHHVHGVHSPG